MIGEQGVAQTANEGAEDQSKANFRVKFHRVSIE
jgi:hypothetical protein